MILIGQYDSPFVRRTAIAMQLYGIQYEHRPWSVWANAAELAAHNPLRRVPTLVLDDGECLIESSAILDYLDELVGEARALLPRQGPLRRAGLHVVALATGLGDKAVSLFYEKLLHADVSEKWVARCHAQISDVLSALEADRTQRATPYWFGDSLTHADIAVACVLRFLGESHPGAFDLARWPTLARHSARCEALSVFSEICQPFLVTA